MQERATTDLYYVHLFNDFSGSPRVLRDAIDSEVHTAKNTYIFTSKHQGFLDDVNAKRVNCFYARSNFRLIQLCYFLIAQVVIFLKLFSYMLLGVVQGRKSVVFINTMLPFGAGLASKFLAKKVIYYVHETYINPDILKRFLRFFIEHCATHVIFVSKYLSANERFNKPAQCVIYNGLRSDFSIPDKIDFQAKFLTKQLFFAGSLKLYKGIDKLVEIARLMPGFSVIAALNCEQSDLNEFIDKYSPPSNMKLLIRPENIQQYFSTSFVVLNLSSEIYCVETFGLSLIEGMACGTPVIAPSVGGPVEFVTEKNGLLISADEVNGIVSFINDLSCSEDVWLRYAQQALLTSESFSAEQYKQSFKAYFEHNDSMSLLQSMKPFAQKYQLKTLLWRLGETDLK